MAVFGVVSEPIPRVLHQTWKSTDVPATWAAYRDSWLERHPGWGYILWTDADIERLIVDNHPWFLATWRAFPRHIQRVDAAKYFILYTHGGVYADLDCECLHSVEPLLEAGGAVVGMTRDRVIECAFLASSSRHALWEEAFRDMQCPPRLARLFAHLPHVLAFQGVYVLYTTGPRMITRAVRRYGERAASSQLASRAPAPGGQLQRLTVLEPGTLSRRSWLQRFERGADEGGFIRHHYSDSWLTPAEVRLTRHYTVRKLSAAVASLVALLLVAGLLFLRSC